MSHQGSLRYVVLMMSLQTESYLSDEEALLIDLSCELNKNNIFCFCL